MVDEEIAKTLSSVKKVNFFGKGDSMYPYNKRLVHNAQTLRKNMTAEEKRLWYDFLRLLPVTVKRQKNIENYILDFYIASAKLAIEIDGAQHSLPENKEADAERDATLSRRGITVLKYTNKDINERYHAVCEAVLDILQLTASDLKIKASSFKE
ncbi:MAG: endonuclease domain-containing protein [Clostridia bacterium]|nr:endonuclease domain-containing protein [Clostridia bacterium]